jgi:hypothetical protein
MCDIIHPVPSTGQFAANIALEALLNAHIQEAKFCPEYESAFGSFKIFEKMLDPLNQLVKDPFYFVDKTIGELKMQADLLREEFKLKIDEKADLIIKQLSQYQQDCYQAVYDNGNVQLKQMNVRVKELNEKFAIWKQCLGKFDSNEAVWAEIKESSLKESGNLEFLLPEYQELLLMEKLSHYEYMVCEFEEVTLSSDREYAFF